MAGSSLPGGRVQGREHGPGEAGTPQGAGPCERVPLLPGPGCAPRTPRPLRNLSGDDAGELSGYWAKLSAGGKVAVALEKQMWGDTFGMCTDRFGIEWMVNIAGAPAA
ncbi:VOC family protein [Streptomyces sp. NBC_00328]|uniref:VOC family protein n=1 Tax=Streptomyces sp. NBC_00328 TaxID=2903646 RepID=UPI002E2AA117|nr:VOC family protein [Streptomyces sp. NBC_00328]